ncbi:MAG: SIS domain-containing protein [Saprospiraceae bacterium]|nr:SIS domain-containing protein [Saprospiraceae bacterium]
MQEKIKSELNQHLEVIHALHNNSEWISTLHRISVECIRCLRGGGKILLCGNGGSAADAQHIAAELSGRYMLDRDPLFVEALHVNTSYLTAVANDYDFSEVFSRAILAKGRPGDILIGLSTSGTSPNVIKAFTAAKKQGMHTVAFTGMRENSLDQQADFCLKVPSPETPRIQEIHILFGHMLCLMIEDALFGNKV